MKQIHFNLSPKDFDLKVKELFKIDDFIMVGTWLLSKYDVVRATEFGFPSQERKDFVKFKLIRRNFFSRPALEDETVYLQLKTIEGKNYVIASRQPINPADTSFLANFGTGFITWKNLSEGYVETRFPCERSLVLGRKQTEEALDYFRGRMKRFFNDYTNVFCLALKLSEEEFKEKSGEIEEFFLSSVKEEDLGALGFNFSPAAEVIVRVFPVFFENRVVVHRVLAYGHTQLLHSSYEVAEFKVK